MGILGGPRRAKEAGMLEVVPLREAFDKALERVFSEVPFEERLEATRRALAHWGLSEDLVWKGALPGAINGSAVPEGLIRRPPVRFVRYGSLVLEVREGYEAPDKPLPKGVWVPQSLTTPLIFPHWSGARGGIPAPLVEGAGKALALLAREVGVASPPPLPETTVRILNPPMRVGDFLLFHFEVEGVRGREDMILVSGAGGALLLELFPWGEPLERREQKKKAWKLFGEALSRLLRGKPAFFPEEELAKLLETDELSGELAVEGLRHPKVFPFLSL